MTTKSRPADSQVLGRGIGFDVRDERPIDHAKIADHPEIVRDGLRDAGRKPRHFRLAGDVREIEHRDRS